MTEKNTEKKYVGLDGLSDFLDNLKDTFSPVDHTHEFEVEINVDTQLSSTSTNPVQNKVINAEFEAIGQAFDVLESALDEKGVFYATYGTTTHAEVDAAYKAGRTIYALIPYEGIGTLVAGLCVGQEGLGYGFSATARIPSTDYISTITAQLAINNSWYISDTYAAPLEHSHEFSDLNGVAPSEHGHEISDVVGLEERLTTFYAVVDSTEYSEIEAAWNAGRDVIAIYGGNALLPLIGNLGTTGVFGGIYGKSYVICAISEKDGWLVETMEYATKDELDALESSIQTLLDGKADSNHSHSISDITNLQSTLDSKADTSHNHDNRYYTETEINAKLEDINKELTGKAIKEHNHDGKYDALGSAKKVQDNLDLVSDKLDSHTENGDVHVTTANKNNWNSAYTHSTSTHARTDATKVESSSNGKIKINGTDTTVYSHPSSGVAAGTYKSVTVNAQGHVTAGTNPTTLSDYGITDGETKGAAAAALEDAIEYADGKFSELSTGKADTDHNHDGEYDKKGDANAALASANDYTDGKVSGLASTSVVDNKISSHNTSNSAHSDIRGLITALSTKLNNFLDVNDETTDQLSEVLTLINNNKGTLESLTTNKINVSDIVDNLTTSSASKVLSAKQGVAIKALIDALDAELDSHGHAIADVSGLQSALDGKAASSHGTHVSYSTTAPVMDGTASVGTASTVARSDHKHPTDTTRASKTEFDSHVTTTNSHIGDTTKHITSTERSNWNTAYNHSQSTHAPSNAEKNQNAFSNITVGSTTIAADTTTDTLTLVAGSNVTITPDATNDKITIASTIPVATSSALGGVKSGTDITVDANGNVSVNDDSHNHVISNVDGLQTALDGKLGKTTYEYNKELALGGTGKVCIGKFPCYDTNISVEIKSTTSTAYNGTLIIYTQNINTSKGGTYGAVVYGDDNNTLTERIKIQYLSGSNVFSVYIDLPGWSKNLLHIQCVSLAGAPTDVATIVDSIPTTADIVPVNAVKTQLDGKASTAIVSTSANGLAPKLAGGTAKFLRADGTWAVPPDTDTTYSSLKNPYALDFLNNAGTEVDDYDGSNNVKLKAGTNVEMTASNGTVTISATDTTYSNFVKSGSGAKAGLVPAPSTTAGTTKYLREDGTWQVPPDTDTKYSLPNATSSTLGGVKIGSNISVSSGTISVPTASGTQAGVTIVYPSASCTTFSSDSGTVTPLAVQKGAKMFAITRPSSSTNKAITRYSNTTGDVQDSKIIIEDVTNTRDSSKKAQVIAIPAEGGKKMVYGYCTDQIDGTSFIGGIFDASATSYPYNQGLAIGGSSGNLLWKGNKVIDTTSTELTSKAPKASPAFTGTPTAPTAAAGTNTTQIATTAFVTTAITDAIGNAIAASY